MEEFSWQVVLNFIAVYAMRFMETSDWGIFRRIEEDLVWMRRLIILGFSMITAAGLVLRFEVQTGEFMLRGNIFTFFHATKHVAQNYAGIQGLYWVKAIHDLLAELRPSLKARFSLPTRKHLARAKRRLQMHARRRRRR